MQKHQEAATERRGIIAFPLKRWGGVAAGIFIVAAATAFGSSAHSATRSPVKRDVIEVTSPATTATPVYTLTGKVASSSTRAQAQAQLYFRLNHNDYLPLSIRQDGTFVTNFPLRFGQNVIAIDLCSRVDNSCRAHVEKSVVLEDRVPPIVQIKADRSEAAIGDKLTVTAMAIDNKRLEQLAIYENGMLVERAKRSPLTVVVPVQNDDAGDHVYTAVAYDGTFYQQSDPTRVHLLNAKDPVGFSVTLTRQGHTGLYSLSGSIREGRLGTATVAIGSSAPAPLGIHDNAFAGLVSLAPGWNDVAVTAVDVNGVTAREVSPVFNPQVRYMDSADPRLAALKPLVEEIYASYDINADSQPLQRTRALRDWVARNMVHPDSRFHPNGSTADVQVLPEGASWDDVNAILTANRTETGQVFWEQFHYDGYAMLDALLGTLDPATGERQGNGMMEPVEPGRFRIRDLNAFRYPFCTYQVAVLQVLWAAAGFRSVALSTDGHDPVAVLVPGYGWLYSDPTFNEEFRLGVDGPPLAPVDVLRLATEGHRLVIHSFKDIGPGRSGPVWDNRQYPPKSATYFALVPGGFSYLRALTDNRLLGGLADRGVVTVRVSKDPMPGPVVAAESVFGTPSVPDPDLAHRGD